MEAIEPSKMVQGTTWYGRKCTNMKDRMPNKADIHVERQMAE